MKSLSQVEAFCGLACWIDTSITFTRYQLALPTEKHFWTTQGHRKTCAVNDASEPAEEYITIQPLRKEGISWQWQSSVMKCFHSGAESPMRSGEQWKAFTSFFCCFLSILIEKQIKSERNFEEKLNKNKNRHTFKGFNSGSCALRLSVLVRFMVPSNMFWAESQCTGWMEQPQHVLT